MDYKDRFLYYKNSGKYIKMIKILISNLNSKYSILHDNCLK